MSHQSSSKMTVSIVRFILFLGVWLMIADWKKEDFPIGFVASALALWISLSLLPPTTIRPHFIPLARFNLRFLSCSIIAGVDVARRALLPRLDLRPGFVAVPFALPPGVTRNAFLIYSSLQPGTLPTSAEGEVLQVHGLDILQPIAASIGADEALFEKAIGHE
jgi:multicomponent Na+:H+ antiporter subunit E